MAILKTFPKLFRLGIVAKHWILSREAAMHFQTLGREGNTKIIWKVL